MHMTAGNQAATLDHEVTLGMRASARPVEQKDGKNVKDFPGGAVVKNPPANAGDTGSSPGLGRSHLPRSN